ncbi:DUF2800 domain-containing protein [Anaerosalibacter bizertensis]|uniref:DUF2800 domain-containing protein n=1 Tax=Anaerosalibacter bizertensis TaxID=932217 RepID=UPI00351529B2
MGEHALLSASGAERWMNCPPSARLEEMIDEKSSIYAKEGTFAHDLAEQKLLNYLGEMSKTEFNKRLKERKKSKFYSKELEDYVDIYVDFAIEKINGHKTGIVFVEKTVDYNWICREGFGTCDLLILDGDLIEIIDFKFGKGLKIDAKDNSQLKLYALGAIDNFNFIFEAKKVRMTIVQPRLDNISSEEMEVEELINWGEVEVKPLADLAYAGEGDFKPGSYCRWCRVKAICRARADENMKIACMDFKLPALLTDEEILEVLNQIDELTKWTKDVEAYAFNQAVNEGKEWAGFKLVEGRSSRRYSDEGKVAKALLAAGFEEEKIYSKSLLSLTKLEKELGKKVFEETIGDLIIKPPGKLQLVPEEDKRPAVRSSAEIDFKEEF